MKALKLIASIRNRMRILSFCSLAKHSETAEKVHLSSIAKR